MIAASGMPGPEEGGGTATRRLPPLGLALGVVGVAGLAAYGAAAWDRLGQAQRSPLWLVLAVTVLVLMALRPFAGALVVLLAVPCFGNHPGGRGMDLLNLLLAANLLGLCFRALAARRPPPAGLLWRAAALSVASAGISLVAAAPGIAGGAPCATNRSSTDRCG